MVSIAPSGAIRRTRKLPRSATKSDPSAPIASPFGWSTWASVAGPPSPEYPRTPVPATVEIVPSGATRRTAWLRVSAM